jgi:hypothetical protein
MAAAAIGLVCLDGLLPAQTEKVTISLAPRSGQTVHYVAIQDITMEIVPDVPAGQPSLIPTMKLAGKTTLAFTETSGSPDPQGRVTAVLTYEQANGEMSVNGVTMPVTASLPDLVGKTLILVFGADGKLADVTAPPEMTAALGPARQFITDLFKLMPAAALAIGETTTTPFSIPLPVPVPGGVPIVLEGQVKTTLVSVDADGDDHLAKCDQAFEAAMAPQAPSDPASGTMRPSIDMKMLGTGKLQFNVDRGVMKSNESETTVDGVLSFGGSGATALPSAKIHGTIKAALTGKY